MDDIDPRPPHTHTILRPRKPSRWLRKGSWTRRLLLLCGFPLLAHGMLVLFVQPSNDRD